MVTTDNVNESKPTAGTKASIAASDAKEMKAEYVAGKSVAALATEYGYSEAEVEATVVKPAKEDA